MGNDFYRLWLDEGMNYSCALWEGGQKDENLEEAQVRKLSYHIDSANARGKAAVLDIGCGWGGLLHQLSQVHQVGGSVGLTLSEAAWQDHALEQPYDAIISIGAFEHFAALACKLPNTASLVDMALFRIVLEKPRNLFWQ